MSTQPSPSPSVPFSVTQPPQTFRLVELPPDLLDLISSDNRPATLHLKSAPHPTAAHNGTTNASPKAPEEFLHLCSDDKVWAVRQVSTSNSVYVCGTTHIQPTTSHTDGTESANGSNEEFLLSQATQLSNIGVTAISQVSNVLELNEVKHTQQDVENMVRGLVAVYEDPEDITPNRNRDTLMSGTNSHADTPITMRQLASDIAAPARLIQQAFKDMLVFQITSQSEVNTSSTTHQAESGCYIPSAALQLRSWRSLIQTATIAGTDLSQTVSFGPFISTIREDEEEGTLYAAVLTAVIRKLLVGSNGDTDAMRDLDETLLGQLNPQQTTRFVGQILVQCALPVKNGLKLSRLIEQWTALVPDAWAHQCTAADLGEGYVIRPDLTANGDGEDVVYLSDPKGATGPTLATASTPTKPSAAATGKRKWHEKFAAQRNAKK